MNVYLYLSNYKEGCCNQIIIILKICKSKSSKI